MTATRKILFILFYLVTLCIQVCFADEEATLLYTSGKNSFRGLSGEKIDHAKSQNYLERYLKSGDTNDARRVDSLYMLGVINHIGGFGSTENSQQSVKYLEAVLNDKYKSNFHITEAAGYLGTIYIDYMGMLKPNGVKYDLEKAKSYFEIVLSNINEHEDTKITDVNNDEINDILNEIRGLNNQSVQVACYELGKMHEFGYKTFPIDLNKAFKTYGKGALDKKGQCVVAVIDMKWNGKVETKLSKSEILKEYEKSAQKDENKYALEQLGKILLSGEIGQSEENTNKGIGYLESAIALGNDNPLSILHDYYLKQSKLNIGQKRAMYESKAKDIGIKINKLTQPK